MRKDTAAEIKIGTPKISVRIISKRKSVVYAEAPPITYLKNSLLSAVVMWVNILMLRIFKNQHFCSLIGFYLFSWYAYYVLRVQIASLSVEPLFIKFTSVIAVNIEWAWL